MSVFFTSDLHLGQEDILASRLRPWKSIDDHDRALIAGINEVVRADDELYILGDFTIREDDDFVRTWLDAIACKRRHLIVGNHDCAAALFAPGAFVDFADYREIRVDGRLCCLSHYPMLDWNRGDTYYATHDPGAEAFMLHGHVHARGPQANRANAQAGVLRYDVGVDANDYRPVSFEDIRAFFSRHTTSM